MAEERGLSTQEPTSIELSTERIKELAGYAERAADAAYEAVAVNTRRAYKFEHYCYLKWCARSGVAKPVPAISEVVHLYLQELSEKGHIAEDLPSGKLKGQPRPLGYNALMRALAAICRSNIESNNATIWNDPIIEKQRKAFGKDFVPKRKRGIGSDELLLFRVCDLIDNSVTGVRDRALILAGWHGGKRRSEIADARFEDFKITPKGNYQWTIPRSKTDQEGKGFEVFLPLNEDVRYCPVTALKKWFEVSKIDSGPVFRNVVEAREGRDVRIKDEAIDSSVVALRIKHYVAQLELDPKEFGGHSLRRGFITTARREGKRDDEIMAITGQRDPKTLHAYTENIDKERHLASKGMLDNILAAQVPPPEPKRDGESMLFRVVMPSKIVAKLDRMRNAMRVSRDTFLSLIVEQLPE